MKNKENSWFAVKCIFVYEDGDFETLYQYEERITLWQAKDADCAIELAEKEAKQYGKKTKCKYANFCESCLLYKKPDHGKEVYSLFREADIEPQHYTWQPREIEANAFVALKSIRIFTTRFARDTEPSSSRCRGTTPSHHSTGSWQPGRERRTQRFY